MHYSMMWIPALGIIVWGLGGWMITDGVNQKIRFKWIARLIGLAGGFVCGCIAIIIAISTVDDDKFTSAKTTSTVEAPKTKVLDLTPEVLEERMNSNLKRLDSKFKVHFNVEKHEHGSLATYVFNDNNNMMITIDNESGKIKGIVMFTSGDGTIISGFNTLNIALSTVSSTLGADEMKTGKSADIVTGLIKHSYKDDEVFENGIRYSVLTDKDGVTSFFIGPQ